MFYFRLKCKIIHQAYINLGSKFYFYICLSSYNRPVRLMNTYYSILHRKALFFLDLCLLVVQDLNDQQIFVLMRITWNSFINSQQL